MPGRPPPVLLPLLLAAGLALAGRAQAAAAPTPPGPPDPLVAMLRRMDVFLHAHELEGITRDPRFEINPAEFTRLSVVCQLLGYLELERSVPDTRMHRLDIVERADFLVDHFDEIRSGSASDGMLGYALLGAWEETGDPRYREKADLIVDQAKRLHGYPATLNWGLMSGMALARAARLTGDAEAIDHLDRIVGSLADYTLPDGSFPHVCRGKPDVHYTGWMTMELIAIARELDDPARMERALRSVAFLAARVGPDGVTTYTAFCSTCPGYVAVFWSLGGGCGDDYDTRGWVNELGYLALAFDQAGEPARAAAVMDFLHRLEDRGAFPDKWDWLPSPGDAIYVWGSAERSVIRTSILFWTLATILTGRERPSAAGPVHLAAADGALVGAAPPAAAGTADEVDATAGGVSWDAARSALRFRLTAPGAVRLAIHDVRGRRLRSWTETGLGAGPHTVAWDRLDDRGRHVPPGLYFVRLMAGGRRESARLAILPSGTEAVRRVMDSGR